MVNKKVLIVDNEDAIIDSTGMLLKVLGYEPVGLNKAHRILAVALHEMPAIILQDLIMPDFSAKETIRQLRANPATANIPIILFSAVPSLDETVDALGANGYLPKPFDPRALERILQQFVDPHPVKPAVAR